MTQHELVLIDFLVLASEKVLRVGGPVTLAVLGYLHISARLLVKSDLLVGIVSIRSIRLFAGRAGKSFNCWKGQKLTGKAALSFLSSGLSRLSTRIPLPLWKSVPLVMGKSAQSRGAAAECLTKGYSGRQAESLLVQLGLETETYSHYNET